MNSTRIAKSILKLWEVVPDSPENSVGLLSEVFSHPIFTNGSEAERRDIMLKSSESLYSSERDYPWDNYFGTDLTPLLHGKHVLDLGCFTGGRCTFWAERYSLKNLVGIDVSNAFIEAAKQFAMTKKIRADFKLSRGEALSFEDETFDAVLSFDVFEHVQALEKTLSECHRVLKTGGRLFAVFPGYFQPIEHHLSLVTRVPGVQYFFSNKTLIRAYNEIIQERGHAATWYARQSPDLKPWEKGNTINGTTLREFQKLIARHKWKVILHSRKPLGSIGRNMSKRKVPRVVSRLFYPLTYIPGLQEIFLHRITYILEKK